MAPQHIFSTIPLLTFLALAFTTFHLLQFSTGSPSDARQVCKHSSLTFLVYCCFFCFSPLFLLNRSSLIPPMPTKFHHCLQARIHSTLVSPGSRPLPLCFGVTTHCGSHPKYSLKFHQNHHWMTCHPPQLPQPPPSFSTFCSWLGLVGQISSLLVHLVVDLEGENRNPFQPNFEAHQPPIPLSAYQDQGTFIT